MDQSGPERAQQGQNTDLWVTETGGMLQMGRRLASTPQALARLEHLLMAVPALRASLVDLAPAPIKSGSLFFTGEWRSGAPGVRGAFGEATVQVLVKLNCTPFERFWLEALSDLADPTTVVPRVFASGQHLGGDAVQWLVIERLPYKLNEFPRDVKWDMAAEAIARFHAAAARVRLPDPAPEPPIIARMGVAGMRNLVESGLRVGAPAAAQRLLERLDADWEWLERTCPAAVNSGDVHPGNLVCRTPPPARAHTCVIDPLVRIAPWPYDAAYLQANAGDPDARMVQRTVAWRERLGLPVGAPADVERAATLLVGWLSVSMWTAPWLPGLPPRGAPEGAASVPGGPEWLARSVRYIEQAASVG